MRTKFTKKTAAGKNACIFWLRTLLFVCISISLLCCTKKSNSDSAPTQQMTAVIGGTSFHADSCTFYYPIASDTTIIAIMGWGPNQYPIIELYLWGGYHGLGDYDLANAGAQYEASTNSSSYSKAGTCSIKSRSASTITGTFNFTTTDGTVISSGNFTAVY